MRVQPDLFDPLLPDATELTSSTTASTKRNNSDAVPIDHELVDWPEAGPSNSKGKGGIVGPFGAKVAAAMTGAMTTSLFMTPFDVLKTRLQTVEPHFKPEYIPPPPDCCQTPIITSKSIASKSASGSASTTGRSQTLTCLTSAASSPNQLAAATTSASSISPPPQSTTQFISARPIPAPKGCYHPSKWAGIWGEAITFEEALARGVIGPSLKGDGTATLALPRQQRGWFNPAEGSFFAEIAAIRREAGIRGLWKGVGTTLTMSIPSSAIYMLGYEYLLEIIAPHFTGNSDPSANISSLNRTSSSSSASSPVLTPAPLIAGSLARTISATVISPIEMFRTRLQALPQAGKAAPTYASTTADLAKLVKDKGVNVLWRGLGPTLWRDVPFSGLYWAGFEIIKSRLSSSSSPLPTLPPVLLSFISGACSGTISALVTQPFDVLKTRRQVFTPSRDCKAEVLRHRASTVPLAIHVIKSEGWRALFVGVVPRCGKVAPASGLMIACYEGVGRYLGGDA